MTYATLSDMAAAFGDRELIELTDRTGSATVDSALVQRAIDEAGDEIDGHLRGRYALPVAAPIPPLLTRIACDLARYALAAERATEEMQARAAAARKLLAAIAEGRMRLGIAAADPLVNPMAAAKSGPEAVMSREGTSAY